MKKIHDRASATTDARKSKPVANTANDSEDVAAMESATENDKHTPVNAVKTKDKKMKEYIDPILATVREAAKDALKKYDEAYSKSKWKIAHLNETTTLVAPHYSYPQTVDACRLIDKATARVTECASLKDYSDIAKCLLYAKATMTMFVRCKNARKDEFVRLCRKLVAEFEKEPDRFADKIDETIFKPEDDEWWNPDHEGGEEEMLDLLPPTLRNRIWLGIRIRSQGDELFIEHEGNFILRPEWTPLELQLINLYWLYDNDLERIALDLDLFLENISEHFLAFLGEDDGTTFFRMNDASTSDASKEQDAI